MNVLLIIVLVVIALAVVLIKAIDWSVEFAIEWQNRRAFERIKIGSNWVQNTGDPWALPEKITVVDKKDGWVQYKYDGSTHWGSCKARLLTEFNWVELPTEEKL